MRLYAARESSKSHAKPHYLAFDRRCHATTSCEDVLLNRLTSRFAQPLADSELTMSLKLIKQTRECVPAPRTRTHAHSPPACASTPELNDAPIVASLIVAHALNALRARFATMY